MFETHPLSFAGKFVFRISKKDGFNYNDITKMHKVFAQNIFVED